VAEEETTDYHPISHGWEEEELTRRVEGHEDFLLFFMSFKIYSLKYS
jgi:hypothetical protein